MSEAGVAVCAGCEQILPEGHFYATNKRRCKDCVKASVRANRAEKIEYYRSYDRVRYRESDERKENAKKCAASPAGIAARKAAVERDKALNPEKRRARSAVANGIRDGKLQRGTECFFCGSSDKLHAHHHDYSRPLDVFWLCPACHGKLHTINGDFLKASEA